MTTALDRSPSKSRRGTRVSGVSAIVLIVVSVAMAAAVLLAPLPREAIGGLVVALSITLILLGVHIAISMFLAAVLGLLAFGGIPFIAATLEEGVYGGAASWSLSVMPMFILMGMAMWRSGLTKSVYAAARQWLGRMPGGLAIGTNFAGAGLAAASGSSVGISYALGRIAIPEMLRSGYAPSLATGTIAMVGVLGQLIPPSIVLVIYAGIAQTPVGPQLLAAMVPGVLIALGFGLIILIRAVLQPKLAPPVELPGVTWGTRFKSLVPTLPMVGIVALVLGGLYFGWFTATEAGAFGAAAALLLGVLFGDRGLRTGRGFFTFMKQVLVDSVAATAGIFLLVVAVEVLTRTLTLSRLADGLAQGVVDLNLGRVEFLLILVVVYLVLGMFLDPLAMMLITFPVFAAPLAELGVDFIWFGVFIVILSEIGIVSPPIGMLSFIVHRLAQDPEINLGRKISLTEVFRGVLWFILVALIVVVALIFFPDLAMWLPGQAVVK